MLHCYAFFFIVFYKGDPYIYYFLKFIIQMIYSLGNITVGNVLEVLPFGNEVDFITVKGSTLMKALEKSVEDWDPQDQSGGFLQFSGRFSYSNNITVLSTSLGKTFFAWRFILNENILF